MRRGQSLLLLASPPEEERAVRIATALSRDWTVVRPPVGCLPGTLAGMAAAAALVLHLDAAAAASVPPPTAPEVYAPALFAGARLTDPALFVSRFEAEFRLTSRACLVVTATRGDSTMFRLLHGIAPSRLRFGPEAMLAELLPFALTLPPGALGEPEDLLLAFNDVSVQSARSGGAVRVREVLRALDETTVLVVLGEAGRLQLLGPRLLELVVPKTLIHRAEEAEVARWLGLSVGDILTAAHSLSNPALTLVTTTLVPRAKAALFSHCYMAPLLDVIRAAAPALPIIYESHNVEAELKAALLGEHSAATELVQYVTELEARLLRIASLVTCCTSEDAESFAPLARNVIVLEHGVGSANQNVTESSHLPRPFRVGFLGSAHPPNVVAARFIIDHLAPRCPAMVFEIVGSVCRAVGPTDAANVVLRGEVDEAEKTTILRDWYIALNPVEVGGGASVKIASYLGAGLPCIATPCGARGFDLVETCAGWVVELTDFADRLGTLLLSPSERDGAARAALRFAACRHWSETTEDAKNALGLLTCRRADRAQSPQPASLEGAQIVAWAATVPSSWLPYVLGGERHGDTVWGQQLYILPSPGTSELMLTLDPSGCQAPRVTVHDRSSESVLGSDPVDLRQNGLLLVILPHAGCMAIEITASTELKPIIILEATFRIGSEVRPIEFNMRHNSTASCRPGEGLSAPESLVLPQLSHLCDALALAGDALSRASLVKYLYLNRPFIAVVCDGASPLVRVRARDLARRCDRDVVVGRSGVIWRVPPFGACRSVFGRIAHLLIASAEQCYTLVAFGDDRECRLHAVLAAELGIPAIVGTQRIRNL